MRSQSYGEVCGTGVAYARYVSVSITKNYMPMFDVDWLSGRNADGSYTLDGTTSMRVQ